MRHLKNFQQYGQCYAPSKVMAKNSEYPKLCKNPDCRVKSGLTRNQWEKHYENFMATGKCQKKRERKTPLKRDKLEQQMPLPGLESEGIAQNAADRNHQILLPGLRRCNDREVAIHMAAN